MIILILGIVLEIPNMEKVQQAAFLTSICEPRLHHHQDRGNSKLNKLRSQIKTLFARLPDQEIIKLAMQNLMISLSVLTVAKNIDKCLETNLVFYKQILQQLKTIQKQAIKLRNANNSQTARTNQKAKQESVNTMKSIGSRSHANLNVERSNCSRSPGSNDQESVLRKQIQLQLSNRKKTSQLKDRSFAERKQQFLLNKAMKAREMNKKCEKIHHDAAEQQSKNKQAIFQQLQSQQIQDFSIWAKKSKRAPLTSWKHSRAHLNTCNDELVSEFYQNSHDFTISERPVLFTKISSHGKQTSFVNGNTSGISDCKNSKAKLKCAILQSSKQNLHSYHKKIRDTLQRKSLLDQQKTQFAIEKIILKNLHIQSIHKIKGLSKEQSMIKSRQKFSCKETLNQPNIKSINSLPDDLQLRIQAKLSEGQSRKNAILLEKSQKIRDNILRKREDFIQRRSEIEWNRKQNIMVEQQMQIQMRKQMQLSKYRRDNNVQFLIKKKRQQCQRRQVLSEQIVNLKKAPSTFLQNKLQAYNKQMQMSIFQLWVNP